MQVKEKKQTERLKKVKVMKTFLIIRRDDKGKKYIAGMIHQDTYPSTLKKELGCEIKEVTASCHIYI